MKLNIFKPPVYCYSVKKRSYIVLIVIIFASGLIMGNPANSDEVVKKNCNQKDVKICPECLQIHNALYIYDISMILDYLTYTNCQSKFTDYCPLSNHSAEYNDIFSSKQIGFDDYLNSFDSKVSNIDIDEIINYSHYSNEDINSEKILKKGGSVPDEEYRYSLLFGRLHRLRIGRTGVLKIGNKEYNLMARTINDFDTFEGLQAGFLNLTRKFKGGQAGLANIGEWITGFQFGIYNMQYYFSGVQIGLVNISEYFEGTQIGLINIAGHHKGNPIGLINYAGNGRMRFVSWIDADSGTNLGIKFHVNDTYTMLYFGYTPELSNSPEDEVPLTLGYKYGFHFSLKPFFINTDLGYAWLDRGTFLKYDDYEDEHCFSFRLITGYDITENFSLFIGGAMNFNWMHNSSLDTGEITFNLLAGIELFK